MQHRSTHRMLSIASFAGLLLVANAGQAFAQGGGAGGGEGQRMREGRQPGGQRGGGFGGGGVMRGLMQGQWSQVPALREGDMRSAIENTLETSPLSEEQREALTALFRSFGDQLDAADNKVREANRAAMEKFREERDASVFDSVRTLRETNAKEQQALEATLLSDVKAVLTPEQLNSWNTIEASANRSRSLRRGFLSSERVSLRNVVREAIPEGPLATELKDALTEYETQLDSALRVRDALLASSTGVGEAIREGDMEKATKMLEEREQAARNVKQLNERFAGQIKSLMPEEKREAFDRTYEKAAFPDAYRKSGSQEALDTALEMHDLTDDQRTQLTAIAERFDPRFTSLRAKTIAARKEAEDNTKVADLIARMTAGGRGQGGNDRIDAVETTMEERRALDRELREELTKILTPEQAKIAIPQRGEGREGGRGGRNRDNIPM